MIGVRSLPVSLLLCLVLGLSSALASARDEAPVGTVRLIDGSAAVEPASGAAHALHNGDGVHEGDILVTGADGEIHVQMADLAYLAVRANSRVRITAYQAEGGDTDHSTVELLKGALRSITGWIGRYNRQNYHLRTATATIGIRGTDHETLVVDHDDKSAAAGSYEHVLQGGVALGNDKGSVDIAAGAAGFAPSRVEGPPKALPQVPDIFPKGKHEKLLEGLHDKIQDSADKARKKKREEVEKGEKAGTTATGTAATTGSGDTATAESAKTDSAKTDAEKKATDTDSKSESQTKRDAIRNKPKRPKLP